MKVALVHDFLVRYGGAEKLLQCFMELFPDAKIHTLFYDEKKMGTHFPKQKIITSSLQKYYRLSFGSYTHLVGMMPAAIEEFDFSGYDLVLSSSAAFSHGIITGPETKHICYVHSPMRWAWDYFYKFQKEKKFGFFTKILFRSFMHKIRLWDVVSCGRPDRIIAASKLIKGRIQKYWHKESEVIYPFVDTKNFFPADSPTKNYYLVVSQLVPYKKIDQIVNAFNEFGEKLIIVGEGSELRHLKNIANSNIEFTGAKYGKDLLSYYQSAKAFIFSGIDDFGMTPIEAMACGVPVIAYKGGGVIETVLHKITGYFYDKQTPEDLLQCLKTCDMNSINPKDCIKRAKEFGKEIFVKKIKKIITNL